MAEWHVGDSLSCSKTITEADLKLYTGLCGDFSPLHEDEEYARRSPFGRRIVPGLLTVSVVSAALSQRLADFVLTSHNFTYVRPVYVGDTITATTTIVAYDPGTGRMTLDSTYQNQLDEVVVLGRSHLLNLAHVQSYARLVAAFRH